MTGNNVFNKKQIAVIFKIAFLEAMALSIILPTVQSTGEVVTCTGTNIRCNGEGQFWQTGNVTMTLTNPGVIQQLTVPFGVPFSPFAPRGHAWILNVAPQGPVAVNYDIYNTNFTTTVQTFAITQAPVVFFPSNNLFTIFPCGQVGCGVGTVGISLNMVNGLATGGVTCYLQGQDQTTLLWESLGINANTPSVTFAIAGIQVSAQANINFTLIQQNSLFTKVRMACNSLTVNTRTIRINQVNLIAVTPATQLEPTVVVTTPMNITLELEGSINFLNVPQVVIWIAYACLNGQAVNHNPSNC